MKYVIDLLQRDLNNELKFAELPDWLDASTKADKEAGIESNRLSLERIPQLRKALKILNEHQGETPSVEKNEDERSICPHCGSDNLDKAHGDIHCSNCCRHWKDKCGSSGL